MKIIENRKSGGEIIGVNGGVANEEMVVAIWREMGRNRAARRVTAVKAASLARHRTAKWHSVSIAHRGRLALFGARSLCRRVTRGSVAT